LPQEKIRGSEKKKRSFFGIPNETSYQERRICLTPDAVNSLSFNGHRVMIEAGTGENSVIRTKEYNAGAEITNDTAKVFSCPMMKVGPPPLLKSQ
jgi:alanine dehydrogenase